MTDATRRVLVVTGASSGIGRAVVEEALQREYAVVAGARRAGRLQEVLEAARRAGAAERLRVLETDVRQDADNVALIALAEAEFGAVDVLLANAGFGVVGKLEDLEIEDYERQFETNFFGVLRTIQAGLPALARSRGRVVLMGSVSGHVSIPGTSAYSASKFAVRALAEALEEELRPRGISVTLLSPGFVESEFRQVDNEGCRHEEAPDPVPRRMVMPVQVAARQILRGIERGRRELILTRTGKLVVFLQRHAPWLQRFLFRRLSIEARPDPGAPDRA